MNTLNTMLFHVKELIDAMCYPFYVLSRRRPWTPGYYTAKRLLIQHGIDHGLLVPGSVLPKGFGFRLDERVIEYPWVFARLPENPGKLLDAGSSLNYSFLVSRSPLTKAKLSICTLAPERRCYWRLGISYVFDDLRSSVFRTGTFDTIVSISTIEHIGLDNVRYTTDEAKRENDSAGFLAAVREFRRVLRPGGVCFITVPYGKAIKRGWFQVFDASMVKMVLEEFRPRKEEVEYFGYSGEGWHTADAADLAQLVSLDARQDEPSHQDLAAFSRGLVCMRLFA